jgi:hypothetical protein
MIEAMKQALEAFDNLARYADTCELFLKEIHPGKADALRERVTKSIEAITSLRQAIEQAEKQEPVAWQGVYDKTDLYYRKPVQGDVRPLYTTPPAAPVQEPYCYHDGRNIVDKQFASHSDVFPLYTTPPAAQPCPYIRSTAEGTHHCALAQRQPLTDERIDAGVAAWFATETVVGGRPFEKRMRAAIEAAHGIGEKNDF